MMSIVKQCALTVFVVLLIGCTSCQSSLLKVSIYYESLCPDSINFITNQLYPSYDNFKDRIQLDFVPYGKASQTKLESGGWSFRCQHGSDECRGNKYQACALNQRKGQDTDAKFVNCVMSLADPSDPEGIQNCAVKDGYDWNKITTCYKYDEGSDILAAYGDRTHSLSPPLKFIPTIILNDVFDQGIQDQLLRDFEGAICSKLSEPKPNVCKS